MSDRGAGFLPEGSAWAPPPSPVRHSYGLTVRHHGLATAIGLLVRTMPYAFARFGILLAYSVACIVWIVVAFGGAAWFATHVAGAFGVLWFVLCVVGVGWFWGTVLRYALHLLACGHVAVLTDLIVRGQVGNGAESMLSYGKRVVLARFGEVNILFGMNMLVRGILNSFHRTLDWIGEMIPIPGLESLSSLVTMILRAATRYLDKVILSYNLARNDGNPWIGAREGLVYYAQNAKPILMTSIWIVLLERLLTFVLWLLLLAPAATITVMLPSGVRESGGIVTVLIAILLAATLRSAFIKPLFLIMMMVRFHALIENQPINQEWDQRLVAASDKFATLGTDFLTPAGHHAPMGSSWLIDDAGCHATRLGALSNQGVRRPSSADRRGSRQMAIADKPEEQGNAAQIAYWNETAAVTWTAMQDHLDAMFAKLTAIALDAAAPQPGERVIDVGCGCGATVLELARRVAPGGSVTGVDVSAPMAARARERIAAASLGNATVEVSDASAHAFQPGAADLLFSRFGVMFFADPTSAFATIRRGIRPGGRLLFAAWRTFADNPWFRVPAEAAAHLLPPSPPMDPDAPGPFAFANPDRVRDILTAAGWSGIDLARHDVPLRIAAPGCIQQAAALATRVGGLARILADATPETKARVAEAIAAVLPQYDGPDGICLRGSIWLASARN